MVSSLLDSQHVVRWDWFDFAIAMALAASGTLLTTKKAMPLAWTLLVPVSLHFVFHCLLVAHSH
jgi:hypothetical protein